MSLTLDHNQSLTIIFRDRNDVDICVTGPAQIHTEQGITTVSKDGNLWRYLDKDVLYIHKAVRTSASRSDGLVPNGEQW